MDSKMEKSINTECPNSGKPVKEDSLTVYRDNVVGFCNPGCRDEFAKDPDENSNAKKIFDALIDG